MIKTLVLAAGFGATALSAQAATIQAVYTSVITYAEGTTLGGNGVFAGDTFSATYIYDTDLGTRSTGATYDYLLGADAITSLTISFKGWSFTFDPNSDGFVGVNNNLGPMEYSANAFGSGTVGSLFYAVNLQNYLKSSAANPPNLEAPATANADIRSVFGFDIRFIDPRRAFVKLSMLRVSRKA
jgi:hypothetical protein